jgi:hypothetical protein
VPGDAVFEFETGGVSRKLTLEELREALYPSGFPDVGPIHGSLAQLGALVNQLTAVYGSTQNAVDAALAAEAARLAAVIAKGQAEQLAIGIGNAVTGLDRISQTLLAQILRVDNLDDLLDLRTLIEGQPLGNFVANLDQARIDGDTLINSTISLIGSKTANGQGFVLNANAVQTTPGIYLAASLEQIEATVSGFSGSITDINEVLLTPTTGLVARLNILTGSVGNIDGAVQELQSVVLTPTTGLIGTVSALSASVGDQAASVQNINQIVLNPSGILATGALRLDVNGHIIGMTLSNDGTTGDAVFIVDKFQIIDPNGGAPFQAFAVENGVIKMHNVEVDTLKVNTLDPIFNSGGAQNLDPNSWLQKLPGGIIIQGGRYRQTIVSETTVSVDFNAPFPNQTLTVIAIPFLSFASVTRDLWMQLLGEPSVSNATFMTQSSTKNSQQIDGFDWLAFGR